MKRTVAAVLLMVAVWLAGCGAKISKDTYVSVMSEMGCRLVMENSPGGEAVLKEKGVTEADIMEFRKKSNRNDMMAAATEIATKVAACHGVGAPHP